MSAGGLRPLSHLGRSTLSALVGAALVLVAACAAPTEPPPGSTAAAVAAAPAAAALESSPPSEAPRGTLVVHGTGDVNLDPSYIPALRARGYEHAWTGLNGLFTDDDLTVVNLECPVSDRGTIVPKEFNFRCDPAALPAAQAAGVDVANLANNHSGDFGPDALLDSVRTAAQQRHRPGRGRGEPAGGVDAGGRRARRVADRGARVRRGRPGGRLARGPEPPGHGQRRRHRGDGGGRPRRGRGGGPGVRHRPLGRRARHPAARRRRRPGARDDRRRGGRRVRPPLRTGCSRSAPTAAGRSPGGWATSSGPRCPMPGRARRWPSSW